MRKAVLILLFAAAACTLLFGGRYSPDGFDLSTERVVVFKDGYAMFIKRGEGKIPDNCKLFLNDIPKASLGTVWAVPDKYAMKNMTTRKWLRGDKDDARESREMVLEFERKAAGKTDGLTLTHFGPGVRWVPTYKLDLETADTAKMSMMAELLNEGEDISGATLDLVVGVPNFRFKDHASPLSLLSELNNPFAPKQTNRYYRQPGVDQFSNALASQVSTGMMDYYMELPAMENPEGTNVPILPGDLSGSSHKDLFVYHVPDVELAEGERAAFPIFTKSVPYKDLYTWNPRRTRYLEENKYEQGGGASPLKLDQNEIWHQLELINKTDLPWTTGTALMMDGFLPLGQELLGYTPRGGATLLPMTVAVDIRGSIFEEEIKRTPNTYRYSGHMWTKLEYVGRVEIRNHKNEDVNLRVSYDFGGHATGVSDGGEVTVGEYQPGDWQSGHSRSGLNAHSTVRWDVDLKAGEKKEMTFRFYYYLW